MYKFNNLYPTNEEIVLGATRYRDEVVAGDPLMALFPFVGYAVSRVRMARPLDDFGQTPLRPLDTNYPEAPLPGSEEREYVPLSFGEKAKLLERYLDEGRSLGSPAARVQMDVEIGRMQRTLNNRMIRALKDCTYRLALTGVVSGQSDNGVLVTRVQVSTRTVTIGTVWSDFANSTPLKDLVALAPDLNRETGYSFDSAAIVMMNSKTMSWLKQNSNAADLGREYSKLLSSPGNSDVQSIVLNKAGVRVVVNDAMLRNKVNGKLVNTPLIPDGKVLWVASSDVGGNQLGEIQETSNSELNGGTGIFAKLVNPNEPPTLPTAFIGWKGGPALYYEDKRVVLTVGS